MSIPPQAYFVERIGGDRVDVESFLPPGSSPETYEPLPVQMVRLTSAQIFFTIGVPFEKTLLRRISGVETNLQIVNMVEGISLIESTGHDHHTGSDSATGTGGNDPKHSTDPHIWLDPVRVKSIASLVCHILCEYLPDQHETFNRNRERFQEELDQLHERIARRLAPFKGRPFYVYHPAFGYFAERYGLKQVAVETEGKEPTSRRLPQLIEKMKREKVTTLFVQTQFPTRAVHIIAQEIGAKVVPLDPLAKNTIKNLERITEEIEKALASQEPPR